MTWEEQCEFVEIYFKEMDNDKGGVSVWEKKEKQLEKNLGSTK